MKGGSVLRRQFVPIATAEYENPPWDAQPLPGTAKEVAALRQWLCGAPESGDLAVGGGLGGPEAFTEPFA
ncbi:MAG: hypothetical protein JXA67_06570, partial [Micromonosporaceae bacterium]|nr:hypothetical protein [Micromonosporaceae bacterium]